MAPATSRKASSIEILSTTGVKSPQDLDDLVTEPLVLAKMAGHEHEARAQLSGRADRHAGRDPERPGLVGSGEHDATADGDRPPSEGGVEQLLDRGIKGVEVGVEDGGRPVIGHTATLVEHMFPVYGLNGPRGGVSGAVRIGARRADTAQARPASWASRAICRGFVAAGVWSGCG